MKVGIVGFGTAGGARLGGYERVGNARVTAVADPRAARGGLVPHCGRDVAVYPSIDELLADADVDLLDVCSPPVHHVEHTLKGLAAGCHVLCEKPVATKVTDARALVDRSRATGLLLYPAHNYGMSPMMRVLRDAVDSHRLGEPVKATFRIVRTGHARGVSDWRPDWRRSTEEACGGILLDHGTHCVYMATRLFEVAPRQVACTLRWGQDGPAGVEEAATVRLDFGSGRGCTIELSWAGDRRENHYELTGTDGTVAITNDVVRFSGPSAAGPAEVSSPTADSAHVDWFPPMYADLLCAVEDPARRSRVLDEVLTTTRVLETAYASALDGGRPAELVPA